MTHLFGCFLACKLDKHGALEVFRRQVAAEADAVDWAVLGKQVLHGVEGSIKGERGCIQRALVNQFAGPLRVG